MREHLSQATQIPSMHKGSTYKFGAATDPIAEALRLRQQASLLESAELKTLVDLGLPELGTAVDVGCGPGFFAHRLVEHRPELRVIGVDVSASALREASHTLNPIRGDVRRLPLRCNLSDFTFARIVLKHVHDPELAIAEMVRVTRPGGRVVVVETDHAGVVLYPDIDTLDEVLQSRQAIMKHHGADARIARRLPMLFRQAGLDDVSIRVLPFSTSDIGVSNFAKIILGGFSSAIDAGLMDQALMCAWPARVDEWSKNPDAFGWFSALFVAGTRGATDTAD